MANSFVTAIDIGHYSIKVVVLKAVDDGIELAYYQELPTVGGIFSDSYTLDHHGCVKTLKEVKSHLPILASNVVLAIPNNAVINKKVQIEAQLPPEEVEFGIYQAFASYSPFPIEALSLDYTELTSPQTDHHAVHYQVYATRKEVIDNRVALLKSLHLKPLVIDTFAHGLLHAWQLAHLYNRKNKNWLLVDIGFSQTSLCIMSEGSASSYFKELAFSAQELQPFVAPQSMEAQVMLSKHQHKDALRLFNQTIVEFAQNLAREISLYQSLNSSQSIQGVWLTGGGADLLQQLNSCRQFEDLYLTSWLSEYLTLPIEFFDPFQAVTQEVNKPSFLMSKLFQKHLAQQVQQDSQPSNNLTHCRFSLAIGLAIRGIQWQQSHHHKTNKKGDHCA